ncbi:MAG: glycosyltransferase [Rhodobacterales bacterium]|jgi:glycosyltransferase Alg8|nr:glycosyltransferase [Rhodobacterales bacterium]
MFTALTHGAYWAAIYLLMTVIPLGIIAHSEHAVNTIFILGFLGTWRYSWAAINFSRAAFFYWIVYPKRKAKAFRKFARLGVPSHAYFLVTTYMVDAESTIACYRGLFLAAARARDGATIVASVVDGSDERLIRSLYHTCPEDMSRVELVIDRIKSSGKRDALARTLRIIARHAPTRHDIVVFVDGDTIVPIDIVEHSAPIFTNPKVGALTTDEAVMIEKKNLFRDWFILRFNQRQVMMCSMGIGNRVLTLTGRMSVFRADLATNPEFIEQINNDYLDHWRLGRVKFLTGDDKSTWYWLLKNGYEMTYLPDVQSLSMETQPRPTFFESSNVLMTRWFGNMMRTNSRALGISPAKIGFFTWWSILDQRISMWTTLVGPIAVSYAALADSPTIIPIYIGWVMFTRYVFCVIISVFRGSWFPITHPFILYFGQIAGSFVKTIVLFRLNQQKWTRQGAGGSVQPSREARIQAIESNFHHAIALAALTLAVIVMAQI